MRQDAVGIRRLELIGLNVYDIDSDRGVVSIRQGKGQKDRVVPIGKRALAWTEKYRHEVRPSLVIDPNETALFLTQTGKPFTVTPMSVLVRAYVDKAAIGKTDSCHLFRHTMATLMLENGADLRFIQAMLGHVKLDTTQIYTQVSIRKLKEIHEATHPARLERETKNEKPKESQDDPPQPEKRDDNKKVVRRLVVVVWRVVVVVPMWTGPRSGPCPHAGIRLVIFQAVVYNERRNCPHPDLQGTGHATRHQTDRRFRIQEDIWQPGKRQCVDGAAQCNPRTACADH